MWWRGISNPNVRRRNCFRMQWTGVMDYLIHVMFKSGRDLFLSDVIPHFSSHPTMFPWWHLYDSFPQLQNEFQLLLFVVYAVCIGVDALQLGYGSHHLFMERSSNSFVTILRHFCGFWHINNPCVFAARWISIPYLHWDSRTSLACCPSNIGVVPPGLSLVSLFSSLFPFKSSLKLFPWALQTPVQRSCPPFETRKVYPILHHDQQAWCHANWPMIKNPQILPVTPGLEAGIDLMALLVSSVIIPCNWRHRRKHYLCSWFFNLLSQGHKVVLIALRLLVASLHCYLPEKSDNNLRAVPR